MPFSFRKLKMDIQEAFLIKKCHPSMSIQLYKSGTSVTLKCSRSLYLPGSGDTMTLSWIFRTTQVLQLYGLRPKYSYYYWMCSFFYFRIYSLSNVYCQGLIAERFCYAYFLWTIIIKMKFYVLLSFIAIWYITATRLRIQDFSYPLPLPGVSQHLSFTETYF